MYTDLRSQESIDNYDNISSGNPVVTYTTIPVIAACVRTFGSLEDDEMIRLDFPSRIVSGHLICVHDYFYATGSNSWDLHHGINTTHNWNQIGLEGGKIVIAITNGGFGTTAYATDVAHGLYTGNTVVISGATQSAYNGTFIITVTGPNTYNYTMLSEPVGAATGSPSRGFNTSTRSRFQQRYSGYGDGTLVIDTQPYVVGAAITGVGAGGSRMTPWVTNSITGNQWHRVVSEVKMLSDTPTYSLRIITEDEIVTVVYNDVPCPTLVANGGLSRWTPLWANSSLVGETVTITNTGATAIVSHSGHELEVGDLIMLHGSREAVQPAYNDEQIVASIIDANTYTYVMQGDPGGPATPNSSYLAMMAHRIHGYIRNCAACWSPSLIDNTPFIIAPLLTPDTGIYEQSVIIPIISPLSFDETIVPITFANSTQLITAPIISQLSLNISPPIVSVNNLYTINIPIISPLSFDFTTVLPQRAGDLTRYADLINLYTNIITPISPAPTGLELYNGGDPNFGSVPLRAVRWNESGSMLEDIHGTNPNNRTTWDVAEGAVRHYFPNGNGTLDAQLRYLFDDGGSARLEIFLQTKHGSDWANYGYGSITGMPTHKSLQLAIAGSVISEQRFTTRDEYHSIVKPDGSICYVDVRDVASLGEQPKGPGDSLRTPTSGIYNSYTKQKGLWYLYQWAIDYGVDSRAYSLSITEEGGNYFRIYDRQDLPNWDRETSGPTYNLIAHINEFWSEWNSSQGAKFIGPSTIHVKDLRIHY